jgi:hypothetical protein
MRANELRIGNLVKHIDKDSVFTVKGIDLLGIDCENDIESMYSSYEMLYHVKLTEEWLLKFGFKKYENSFELRTKGLCFMFFIYSKEIEFYINKAKKLNKVFILGTLGQTNGKEESGINYLYLPLDDSFFEYGVTSFFTNKFLIESSIFIFCF